MDGPERDAAAVQAKFAEWMKLKEKGLNFNDSLLLNATFYNPNISTRLVEFVGVDESGTNFPQNISDTDWLSDQVDYEAISNKQRTDWEAKNPTAAVQKPVEF